MNIFLIFACSTKSHSARMATKKARRDPTISVILHCNQSQSYTQKVSGQKPFTLSVCVECKAKSGRRMGVTQPYKQVRGCMTETMIRWRRQAMITLEGKLSLYCYFTLFFLNTLLQLYFPNGISPMGNSDCLPQVKPAATVTLPNLWCMLGVLVFP